MATPTSAGPNTARPTNWWSDAVRISGPTEEGLLSNPMPNRQNQKDNSCAFLYYSSKKCIFVAIILLVCASVTGCRYSDSLQADSRSLIGRYTSGSHFYRPTRPWHKTRTPRRMYGPEPVIAYRQITFLNRSVQTYSVRGYSTSSILIS